MTSRRTRTRRPAGAAVLGSVSALTAPVSAAAGSHSERAHGGAVVSVEQVADLQRRKWPGNSTERSTVLIVQRNPQDKGFAPQPEPWRIEQNYGILILHRRLVRDYDRGGASLSTEAEPEPET